MMLVIFAATSAALVASQVAWFRAAVAFALLALALAAALFLFEIHDPVDGFRLPWLQVRAAPVLESWSA